jgi:hypothetical protein
MRGRLTNSHFKWTKKWGAAQIAAVYRFTLLQGSQPRGSSKKRKQSRRRRYKTQYPERRPPDGSHVEPADGSRPMCTLLVPCPRCKRFVEVIAYRDAKPQEVYIEAHESYMNNVDKRCSFAGSYALPAFDPDFVYFPTKESFTKPISPLERKSHPPAIPDGRPLMERMSDYFLACPFSTLLKMYIQIDRADSTFYELGSIFTEPGAEVGDDDPFIARINHIYETIVAAIEDRLSEALRDSRVEVNEGIACFEDTVSPDVT